MLRSLQKKRFNTLVQIIGSHEVVNDAEVLNVDAAVLANTLENARYLLRRR